MIYLSNGCYCTDLKVNPKNWKQAGATTKKDWYIWYRFYDPTISEPGGKPKRKLIVVKGMNGTKELWERRQLTQVLLNEELILLRTEGFNPNTRKFMNIWPEPEREIDPSTLFIPALRSAAEKLSVTNRVRVGIKSVIKGIEKAAKQLYVSELSISRISRRNIRMVLEQCALNSKKWSNSRYNTYRGYLMMLFKELVELEAVPANPIWDIGKKPVVSRIRPVLSVKERQLIDEHLVVAFPAFRNFVHLFFHSGGRKTELLQLKPSMIDLDRQRYKCVIRKGRQHKEVERTIKTIAIPFWKFFLNDCPSDHFIFGELFKPGKSPMGQDMPTRYWKRYVKEPLSITADFYSLKHLHTSEIVDALDEKAAAHMNAHTSTAMVVNIYDVKQKDRQHNRLKDVSNGFV